MKKSLFAVALALSVSACGKSEIVPTTQKPAGNVEDQMEKEMPLSKEWRSCFIYGANGKPLWDGKICKGNGSDCGRRAVCSIPGGRLDNPDEVIFEDLTREAFRELWNTDEGMEYLLSKGVYVIEE